MLGLRTSGEDNIQTIRVTAVEADGNSRLEVWPPQLYLRIARGKQLLRDVQVWANRHTPPLCTFLAERCRDSGFNAANQASFRSLSRFLLEHRTVSLQ